MKVKPQSALPAIASIYRERQPDREVITTLVRTLNRPEADWQRIDYFPLVRAVLTSLAEDAILARLRIDVMLTCLPAMEWPTELAALSAQGRLDADVLGHFTTSTVRYVRDVPQEDLAGAERALMGSTDPALRRAAFTLLVAQVGSTRTHQWDAAQRERLRQYRADPAPLVAAAAQFTIVPDAEDMSTPTRK